mmetsp:Transcript_59027/g.158937  ORF Transcript_59027/g.158937 Transcript_59027/m.158937 type:complete len:258 (-) Transcript_59027:481-1254(-)
MLRWSAKRFCTSQRCRSQEDKSVGCATQMLGSTALVFPRPSTSSSRGSESFGRGRGRGSGVPLRDAKSVYQHCRAAGSSRWRRPAVFVWRAWLCWQNQKKGSSGHITPGLARGGAGDFGAAAEAWAAAAMALVPTPLERSPAARARLPRRARLRPTLRPGARMAFGSACGPGTGGPRPRGAARDFRLVEALEVGVGAVTSEASGGSSACLEGRRAGAGSNQHWPLSLSCPGTSRRLASWASVCRGSSTLHTMSRMPP